MEQPVEEVVREIQHFANPEVDAVRLDRAAMLTAEVLRHSGPRPLSAEEREYLADHVARGGMAGA